jgi:hypothetical protein
VGEMMEMLFTSKILGTEVKHIFAMEVKVLNEKGRLVKGQIVGIFMHRAFVHIPSAKSGKYFPYNEIFISTDRNGGTIK